MHVNEYSIIGAAATVAGIALYWFLYRQYKRIARRCRQEKCGRTNVRRISKIRLASDETITLRSSRNRRRWFIRRVIKLTFTHCRSCGHIELVRIDMDPISLWHAYWVKWFHHEQYHVDTDPKLGEAFRHKVRQLYLGRRNEDLEPGASDTPPLTLESLAEDYFRELSEFIDGE